MKRLLSLALLCFALPTAVGGGEQPSAPLLSGLINPAGIAIGNDGRIYVSEGGTEGKDGQGKIVIVDKGKSVPLATGLDNPKGMAIWFNAVFVTDKTRVMRIDKKGKMQAFAAATAFPSPPTALHGITVDEQGTLYVADSAGANAGAIYRIDTKGRVTLVSDAKRNPTLKSPRGLVLDGKSRLLVVDHELGELWRINVANGAGTKIAEGFGAAEALAWDMFGRLFISDDKGGRVFVIPRAGDAPILLTSSFKSPTALCMDRAGKQLLVADRSAGSLAPISSAVPGQEIDESPLPIQTTVAFPDLQWTGWTGETEEGKLIPLRPIVLTHAGDGSNRVFVATQHGVIHAFANDPKVKKTSVFLDIQSKVRYNDRENEEGFLGLAFHPKFKENGEFFVYYTIKTGKHINVLSRFRVSKDDPTKADPNSEEELMRFPHLYWNHDGGTICFGPDGYLYIATGDGGSAGDPNNNGQSLKTHLAKVLRIDVDRKDDGKKYGIPKDNPFVNRADALPEIWAYGLRNIWRMAFDRKTAKLWAADVGQNLYEEIDIIVKGGNYGWSKREGLHPFGKNGVSPQPDLIEPIWEYHHDIGKSITGGLVYRGKQLPDLEGAYIYGDYVSGKIWALRYDDAKKRVVANRPIGDRNVAIMSFGEDEKEEIYLLTTSLSGKGILQLVPTSQKGDSSEVANTANLSGTRICPFIAIAQKGDSLEVVNAAGKSVQIQADKLKKLPREKVEVKDAKNQPASYEGVAVEAVLEEAGIMLGKALRGPRLANYLLMEAKDGYRVVFALPEIDSNMTTNLVLLADIKNGKTLDEREGPFCVIVPHENQHARWIKQVTKFSEHSAPISKEKGK